MLNIKNSLFHKFLASRKHNADATQVSLLITAALISKCGMWFCKMDTVAIQRQENVAFVLKTSKLLETSTYLLMQFPYRFCSKQKEHTSREVTKSFCACA